MKKFYLLLALATATTFTFAQATTGCKKADGSIVITFDPNKNCASTPAGSKDSLAKRTEIGFHSGANNFGSGLIKEWNSTNAIKAIRVAGTAGATAKFTITIPNATTYYNAGTTALTNIAFVFNDGWDPARGMRTEWNSEGKDTKDAAACQDFVLPLANLATCLAATQDLRSEMSVRTAPNPFREVTYLTFDNAAGKKFSLSISDVTGRVVRTINNITTDFVEIKRESLATGVYYAVLSDASGKFLTEKLVVQ